jgi:hypothetical protein
MSSDTQYHTVVNKVRFNAIVPLSLEDFQLTTSDSVEPTVVLEDPNVSLYCLDLQRGTAVFVETAPGTDLFSAPFIYQTQYEQAQRVITMPLDTLHRLAADIQIDPDHLVLIYSTGRCGSTLVSHAFNRADHGVSLSEPDAYMQILTGWRSGISDDETVALLTSTTRIMCEAASRCYGATTWAIKFRSFGIHLASLWYRAFPAAKVIFLYREATSWARSYARLMSLFDVQMQQMIPILQSGLGQIDPFIAEYGATIQVTISPVDLLACMWISVMLSCLEIQHNGIPMIAGRFEDLRTNPQAVINDLLDYCGVSISDPNGLTSVLAQDSQAGSVLSQERMNESGAELKDSDLTQIRQFITTHGKGLTPDVIVPTTIRPE